MKKAKHSIILALIPEQRKITHAMMSMIEEYMMWMLLWWRAKYRIIEGFQVYMQNVFNTYLPNPILNLCYEATGSKFDMFEFHKKVAHPLRDAINESFPDLVDHVSRIKKCAFHDHDDFCSTLDMNAHLKSAKKVKEAKKGTGPADKQALPNKTEKGKGGAAELVKEPKEKKEKDNDKTVKE